MEKSNMRNMTLAAMFAALIFLGTFIIRIPIPATNGYIHFGDGFIYIAALILPLPFAAAAAAIGGLLSDILAGYAIYAPWTAVIKALMAVVTALVFHNSNFMQQNDKKFSIAKGLTATIIAGIINVGGYFIAESFMYTPAGAIVSVPMNCLQSAFGIVIFFVLAPVFSRILHVILKDEK